MKTNSQNKDLYPLLNIIKFFLAMCIIAVHTWFLIDFKIGYYLYNVLYRLGVPFFFVASTFILGQKIKNNENNRDSLFKDFIKKNTKIYLYLSCMDMVINLIKSNDFSASSILENIWQILIGNSWSIAWFLGALIISVIILYFIKTPKQFKNLLILGVILYLLGLSFNTYSFVLVDSRFSFLNDFLVNKFITNRNFLFTGFLFTLLGYYIGLIKWDKIEKINIIYFYIAFIIGIFGLLFETILIRKHIPTLTSYDFFMSHLIAIPSLLIISIKSRLNNKINLNTKIFRKLSTYIFYFHPFVLELLNILRNNETFKILNNNVVFFTYVAVISIIISIIYNFYEKKGKEMILFLIKLFTISSIIFIIIYAMNNVIWADEACSLAMNKFSIIEIIKLNLMDVHPPLYYIFLKLFIMFVQNVLGVSNQIVIGKIFSLIPMFLIILVSEVKIKKIWGEKTSALFSLLMVIMPQFIQFYYEIRMYSWAMLFVTLTFIYAYEAYSNGRVSNFIKLSIFTLLAGYTHLYSALMVGIIYAFLFVFIIMKKRALIKKYCIFAVSSIICYIPWIICIFSQINKVNKGFWIPQITLYDCINYIKFIFMPDTADESSKFILFIFMIIVTAIIFVKMILDRNKRFLIIGFCLPFIVITIGVLVSIIKNPVFISRYMFPSLGCMWLIFSIVLFNTKINNLSKNLIIFLLVLVGIANINSFLRNEVALQSEETKFLELKNILNDSDIIITDYGHVQLLIAYELYPKVIYQFQQDNDIMINKLFQNVKGNLTINDIFEYLNSNKEIYFVNSNINNLKENFTNNKIKCKYIGNYKEDWYNMKLYRLEKR